VGRLTEPKGVPTVLHAFANAPNMELTIVGDGPLSEDVRSFADNHPTVRYVGRQSELATYELMRRSEVLVVASELYETFGRVAVEAFAQGTPVITTRSGAVGEIVEDGKTGFLFEPGNADDLAAKIRWAAEHPEEMRRMGEAARREYEQKYTPERNYQMLMDIYQQAIEHRRSRSARRGG